MATKEKFTTAKRRTIIMNNATTREVADRFEKEFGLVVGIDPELGKCKYSFTIYAISGDDALKSFGALFGLSYRRVSASHYYITGEGCI